MLHNARRYGDTVAIDAKDKKNNEGDRFFEKVLCDRHRSPDLPQLQHRVPNFYFTPIQSSFFFIQILIYSEYDIINITDDLRILL